MDLKNLADAIGVGIAILIIPGLFVYKFFEKKWAREGKILGYQSNVIDSGVNIFNASQEAEAIKRSGGIVPTHPGLPFIGGFLALVGFVLIFGINQVHAGIGMVMIGAAFIYGYVLPAHLRKTQLATGIMLGLLVGGIIMGVTDAVPVLAAGKGWAGIAVFLAILLAGLFSRKKPSPK